MQARDIITPTPASDRSTPLLINLNRIAAFVHAVCAVTAAAQREVTLKVYPLYIGARVEPGVTFELVPAAPIEHSSVISLRALIFCFFLITSVAHFGYAQIWRNYYLTQCIARARNPLRFIEYGISASLMMLAITYYTGTIWGYPLFMQIAVTVATMAFGWCAELVNVPKTPDEWTLPLDTRIQPHALAYLPQTASWLATFSQFRLATDGPDDRPKPPDFVFYIVYSEALFYFSFGFCQLYVILNKPKDYYKGEVAYIVLSLTSKVALGGIFLFQLFWDPNAN